MYKWAYLAVPLALALAGPLQAQARMDHSTMAMPGAGGDDAMAAMHDRMMAAAKGGPAERFHRQMIEHHRGAVAMSRQVLGASRDRQTTALARRIIRDQDREIAEMQGWLKRNGKAPQ